MLLRKSIYRPIISKYFKFCSGILMLLLLLSAQVLAQNNTLQIQITSVNEEEENILKKIKFKKQVADLKEAQSQLQRILFALYDKGYIVSSFDSIKEVGKQIQVFFTLGEKYEWIQLREGNADKQLINHINFKEKIYYNRPFSYKELSTLMNKMLDELENNGHPFASVRLDSIEIINHKISAALQIEKNQFFVYDTITIRGNARISKYYLYNYLGIKKGGIYNENTIKKIDSRLRQIVFLNLDRPTEIVFSNETAKPILNLSNRRASQFDFLVGFLPNSAQSGKLLVTGEANVNLLSPFGFGENIRLNWRKLQARTQHLDVGFSFPYLISLPFGVDAGLRLFKRDTLYLDVDWDAGFSYLFVGGNYFKAFVNGRFSNIISIDSNQIISNRQLPEFLDTRKTLWGLEYYFEKLNYRFNPTKGFIVKLRGATGNRKIKVNNNISNIKDPENPGQTFISLFDSIPAKSIQYKLDYRLEKFWRISQRATLRTAITGGAIISDEVFVNEMYRLGGTKLMRGFDEESIFASQFHLTTFEYRFLLGENSFFNLFTDAAYSESKTNNQFDNDFLLGFGAGIAFSTKAGIFSVSYALGKRNSQSVDFRAAKIHFGYVNLF